MTSHRDRRGDASGRAASEDAAERAERAADQAERDRSDTLALAEAARDAALEAARRAGRFSREFVATLISVVGTALGVVVALAWNSALTKWFDQFKHGAKLAALFAYALFVTLLAVVVIFFLGRLVRRLDAEAVEFKIQAKREDDEKK